MGRQRGVVHLSGQFDDTQLSISGKKGIAKLSVPISKDRINSDPDFEGTRRVNAEFKAGSLGADTIQKCLCDLGSLFGDRYMRGRLLGRMIEMVRKGPGDEGKRTLEAVNNGQTLKAFNLNNGDRLKNWFRARHTVTVNADRNTATLDVVPFLIRSGLKVPQSSTHFRVCMCIGVLCDHLYVGGKEVYAPVDPTLNGLNEIGYSSFMPINVQNTGFQVVVALPGLPVLTSTAGLVVSLGIEFFKEVNTVYNMKAVGNAMMIHDVY